MHRGHVRLILAKIHKRVWSDWQLRGYLDHEAPPGFRKNKPCLHILFSDNSSRYTPTIIEDIKRAVIPIAQNYLPNNAIYVLHFNNSTELFDRGLRNMGSRAAQKLKK